MLHALIKLARTKFGERNNIWKAKKSAVNTWVILVWCFEYSRWWLGDTLFMKTLFLLYWNPNENIIISISFFVRLVEVIIYDSCCYFGKKKWWNPSVFYFLNMKKIFVYWLTCRSAECSLVVGGGTFWAWNIAFVTLPPPPKKKREIYIMMCFVFTTIFKANIFNTPSHSYWGVTTGYIFAHSP